MNPNQAEAGPSTPRTPPSTPPPVSTKTASRRKSWFGFVASPFAATSSQSGSPRRKSHAGDQDSEHELVDRSSGGDKEPGTPTTAGKRSSLQLRARDESLELLTIDGDVEASPVARRKKRQAKNREGSGETVRLEDLSGGRRASLRSVMWAPEDGKSGANDAFTNVAMSHTEDKRPPHPQPKITPSPPLKFDNPDPNRPRVSSRTSSLNVPEPPIPPDKPSPRLLSERPLPALPKSPPPPLTLIPTDIVITPSSPRKLQKSQTKSQARRNTASMTDLRAPRAIDVNGQGRPQSSGSASSSRSSSKVISRKSSVIGLGRPKGKDTNGEMLPPPVPQKPQSVSSPHPSRSASPVPKISFAEPEEDEKERGRSEKRDGEGKKDKTKRARSLSGIFTRSTSQPVPSKPGSVVAGSNNGDAEGENVETLAEHNDSGKMGSVLEWLGVRKASSKRRLSENLLVGMDGHAVKRESGESAENRADEQAQPGLSTIPDDPLTKISSNTTIMPHPANGFPGSGSKSEEVNGATSPPIPIAIPSHQSRFIPTESLRIPNPKGPSLASSQLDTLESYISSPTSEHEDFFTPPGAPWVDGTDASQRTPTTSSSSLGPEEPQEGRARSWSDASNTSALVGASNHGSTGEINTTTQSQTPSSFSARPKMANRSNSGNSVIIEKMKGVFSLSSARSRARSKSLLPQEKTMAGEGDTDEFGVKSSGSGRTETSSSTISQQWSPAQATNSSLLDLQLGPRVFADSPLASPRASFSQSTPPSSFVPSNTQQTTETPSAVAPITAKPSRARGRASTVSFATSAPLASLLTPPLPISPDLFPVGSGLTPPRRRPSAIKRFSSGLLGSSAPSSPKGSLFPLPPRSSGSTFSSVGRHDDAMSTATGATSQFVSPGASPRPSTGSGNGGWKVDIKVQEGETAAGWLDRMVGSVGRDDIAGVLASSGDELHSRALELYMAQFDFTHNALDIALRRLLMQISLPKETQQIDRVLEAFAKRYEVCEPGLFGSKDNTYVLAFSMMMLHTDVFNKNNKSKMSKADYIRNTRMEGVSPLILEAFYDNITYTPFVYLDLDSDVTVSNISSGGRSRSGSDALVSTPASSIFASPVTPTGTSGLVSTASSVFTPSVISSTPRRAATPTTTSSLSTKQPDIYALINSNNLHPLRVDLSRVIPPESPFSCIGTRPFLEMSRMQNAFVRAGILRIGGGSAGGVVPSKKKAVGVKPKKAAESGDEGSGTALGEGEVALRVTKVGTLSRKDDALDSTRKTSRKWKSWSVILTGSQLLFFKDPLWALTLQEQMKAESGQVARDERGQVLLPRVARFVPDEVFPVKDAVAVWDRLLTGNPHTFRFHLPHRAYLIQASDEYEMNEWIGLINYAAAFKTSSIRMRAGTMGRDQALLAGAAAASSLRRESRSLDAAGEEGPKGKKIFGGSQTFASNDNTPTAPIGIINVSTPPSILNVRTSGDSQRRRTISSDRSGSSSPVSGKYVLDHVEGESVGIAVRDDGEQLGDIFKAVKAELAAEKGVATVPIVNGNHPSGRVRAGMRVRIPSSQAVRSNAVEVSIRNLQSKLFSSQTTLNTLLTQARNLAILTPFQRTTRDRISAAVSPLAAQIREQRLNIAKYVLWITILQCDLDKEEKEWEGMSGIALQGGRSQKVIKPIDGDLKLVEEGARVRFETQENQNGSKLASEEAGESGHGEEGMEEILNDTNGFHEQLTNGIDIGSSDDGGLSGATSLGKTPQELPILIRLPSEEATTQNVPLVSGQNQRPGMRRHASASNV